MSAVTILETPRLRLREMTRSDLDFVAAMIGHPEVMRYYPKVYDRSEAEACREVLMAHGIPEDAILLEERSRSTEENALYTREIMDANGWETALVVSDGYHLLRAGWIFAQEGIPVYLSPSADPPLINHVTAVGREVLALHWQLFKTIFNIPSTYVPYL